MYFVWQLGKLLFNEIVFFSPMFLILIRLQSLCFHLTLLGFDWPRMWQQKYVAGQTSIQMPQNHISLIFLCNRPSHLDWISSSCKLLFSRIKTNTQKSKPDAKIRTRRDVRKELRCWKFKWEVNIKMQTVELRNFDKFGLIPTVSMSAGQIGATVIFEVSTFYDLGLPLVCFIKSSGRVWFA